MTAAPLKNRKSWLLVTAAIGLPLLLLLAVGGYRVYRVAALQNAFANPEAVGLGRGSGEVEPEWATKSVDYVVEYSGGTVEDKGVLRERLMAIIRSETHLIVLQDPHGFGADIGGALQRFPSVRHFVIVDRRHATSEGDAKILLGHLRQMENLEFVSLHVPELTDTAFASLAGHPRLRRVHLDQGSFTPQILETLKTLPSLEELLIDVHLNPALSGLDTEQLFRDALPGVQVGFGFP